ncbi:MAG: cobalt-precorrin-5B (C(1))-methyltransferase, partial [Polaromonas sp.]
PEAAFVQMGDFLRYAMSAAVKAGLKQVVIGGMVGKLTKIAQGETITHAGRADVNTGLLAELAAGLGAAADVCDDIRSAKTARYAGERMDALGLGTAFHTALAQRVIQTLRGRYPDPFELKVLVCDFDGRKIAEASS